jgi:hypothetical protein
MFCQMCIAVSKPAASSQLSSKSVNPHSTTYKMIASALYAIVFGVLLLDGCWVATIYIWGIKKIQTAATYGLTESTFTVLVLCVQYAVLLVGSASWLWTVSVMVKQVLALWADRGDGCEASRSSKTDI